MDDEAVIKELVDSYGWSRETLAVWRRANYQCEYCQAKLLASVDEYFYGSHVEHIVPDAGEHADNLALACKTCNFIKRKKNFSETGQLLTRDQLIAKATEFISQRRTLNEERLRRVRELLAMLN
jgi:hypothetical protein